MTGNPNFANLRANRFLKECKLMYDCRTIYPQKGTYNSEML